MEVLMLAVGGFVLWWMFVVWVIAWIGGWRRIATIYPAQEKPSGPTFQWQSLEVFPFGGYNNCLNVTLSHHGIYLAPQWLLRFGHPALLIPWECVRPVQQRRCLWIRYYSLPIEVGGKRVRLSWPRGAQDWFETNAAFLPCSKAES